MPPPLGLEEAFVAPDAPPPLAPPAVAPAPIVTAAAPTATAAPITAAPVIAPDPAAVAGATNRSNAGNDKPATARIAIPVNDAINADTPGSVV